MFEANETKAYQVLLYGHTLQGALITRRHWQYHKSRIPAGSPTDIASSYDELIRKAEVRVERAQHALDSWCFQTAGANSYTFDGIVPALEGTERMIVKWDGETRKATLCAEYEVTP